MDWDFYFEGPDAQLNRGENIDTFIPEILYGLPSESVKRTGCAFAMREGEQRPPVCLPEVTLIRGSRMRLPSGEELARYFGYPAVPAELIPATPADEAFFTDPAFRTRTPLWYYFLREAAVEAQTRPEPVPVPELQIQKLGTLGSRVVAEVFYQVLASDGESILHAGRDWRPPVFVFGRSERVRPIDSMAALAEFVSEQAH